MQTMDPRICVTLVSILLLALAVHTSLATSTTTPQARRCYVCGEGADAPFRAALAQAADEQAASSSRHPRPLGSLPNIVTTCEDFERDRNELDKYVLECPPAYTSCLTQVDGDMEVRTCGENLPINDCKSANKIDYCYCSVDLCNSLKRTQIRREIEDSQMGGGLSEHLRQHHNSDDEDLTESSGMEDSHEKHRTMGSSHRVNQNGSQQNHRPGGGSSSNSDDKSYETTQVVMTLKPISSSSSGSGSDRRNTTSTGSNSSAKSGSSSSWRWSLVGFSTTTTRNGGWVALVLIGASMWRFAVSSKGFC